jgi:hypothetical protein
MSSVTSSPLFEIDTAEIGVVDMFGTLGIFSAFDTFNVFGVNIS